jgi:hypothetical protein
MRERGLVLQDGSRGPEGLFPNRSHPDKAPLEVMIQCYILILLDLVHMPIVVSTTIFFSVYTSLVAICYSASIQLVCSDLLSRYNGSDVGRSGARREYSRRGRAQ